MNKIIELHQIAAVRNGYPFRSGLVPSAKGNIRVIQMKDVAESGKLKDSDLTLVQLSEVDARHLVKTNDIVIKTRGNSNKCVLVNQANGDVIAAAPLFVISVTSNIVLPEYLAWYMNQSSAQKYMAGHARGTSIAMVGIHTVEHLPVTIIPVELQRKIVELSELMEREHSLYQQLANRRWQYISKMLLNIVEGEGNE
jgi:restriction endonuclease S subunit